MKVKSRENKKKYTGAYQYSFTLTKDVEAEWALIKYLEELPRGRRSEYIRQRFMNSGSSSQPSSFSLPSEGEKANKVNVNNILRNADEEI